MNLIILILVSYLIGSFPTAYLFDKKIFSKGTKNMGAFNFMLENKNIINTSLVLFIDILKGIIILFISNRLIPTYYGIIIALIFGILGHSYSVWVKFKGGKGLAIACGIVFLLEPLFFIIGILIVSILYLIIKDHIKVGLMGVVIVIFLALIMKLNFS